MDLAAEQKPEGFLMVSALTEDKSKQGNYLVTCVREDGKTNQESRSKAEIEKNEICRLAATAAVKVSPVATVTAGNAGNTPADESPGGAESLPFENSKFVIKLNVAAAKESYLKATSGLDVTRDKSKLQEGLHYCLVPTIFGADSVCKANASELRIGTHTIKGCAAIVTGYLYLSHFSVTGGTVAACK